MILEAGSPGEVIIQQRCILVFVRIQLQVFITLPEPM